jgi:hypothetical protein
LLDPTHTCSTTSEWIRTARRTELLWEEGDDEEVGVMIAAVEGVKDVKLPVIKKFKRELGKLRAA